jgi:hypothetical protein
MAVTDDPAADATSPGAVATSPATTASRKKRRIGWAGRLGRVALGFALGLGLAEAAFHVRDDGAFPHLNLYVADPELGVRLRPNTHQRLRSSPKNPVTSVRVGPDGLRGAGLPSPGDDEILVVGDSQVFGLGVEEHETASAVLGELVDGRAVINAGIPTHGPLEYNAIVREMTRQRRVGTVVYVVNLVNDLFEASRKNVDRHAVWDGWAVRKETAPTSVASFPGREWLFSRSHLVHAVRTEWCRRSGLTIDDRGLPSEGTAADLLGVAQSARAEHGRADEENAALQAKHEQALKEAVAKHLEIDIALDQLALDTFDLKGLESTAFKLSRDNPGDIVVPHTVHQIEDSRSPPQTAHTLVNGAKTRQLMEERIRVFAAYAERMAEPGTGCPYEIANPPEWDMQRRNALFHQNPEMCEELRKGKAHPMLRTREARDAWKKKLDALRAAAPAIVRAWSPLTPVLRDLEAICDEEGAKLLVVALPMDLQVSPEEWAKYGKTAPVDMAPTRVLTEDVVDSARAIGAMGLDATPALAAAEPGAFLDGDIHMTPKGHRALAEAIAKELGGAR